LAKNADKLIIDELAAFKPRLVNSLDLRFTMTSNAAVSMKKADVKP
jgi:hypothetical protein